VTEVTAFFLCMAAQLRLYHWSTRTYARHRAAEELLEQVTDAADRMVEAMCSAGGRPRMAGQPPMRLLDLDDAPGGTADAYLEACERFMTQELPVLLGDDSAMLSIRDDALSAVRRARYAFGLS
jgi:hypothetical protein